MKALNRFLLLFACLALSVLLFARHRLWPTPTTQHEDFYSVRDLHNKHVSEVRPRKDGACRMSMCFDLSRCKDIASTGLRVHLYGGERAEESESFARIRDVISNSNFLESNPKKACLFMTTLFDPLDRDPLSRDFQRPSGQMSAFVPLFGGVNHVLFNLYAGSWPDYSELDFAYNQNFGRVRELLPKAILIKASQSRNAYRPDFDVSLPLFSRHHPLRGPQFVHSSAKAPNSWPKAVVSMGARQKRLLVFKGKRYIYGIGSETRNALHYLNNDKDVLIVTTCKHGKKWKDWKDDKCERDNTEYDKHDYQTLMANSTFCLVPRGRRLGSYRFLEALQLGCIPVILSNGWVLPFEEIIDWKSCVVKADERLLLQIPETLRSFSDLQIAQMRQTCLMVYELYFSSVERIVFTSLLIIQQRIQSHLSLQQLAQQHSPALPALWHVGLGPELVARSPQLTVIVWMTSSHEFSALQKLIQRLEGAPFVHEILVIWSPASPAPPLGRSVRVVKGAHRFAVESSALGTEAVLQLAPNSGLSREEMEFALSVWQSVPSRVLGFVARSHFWSVSSSRFQYSSKWTNDYSLVEMDASLYHARFHDLFLASDHASARNCSDLRFLLLVAEVTREGPLKLTQRKSTCATDFDAFEERRACMASLSTVTSYWPLVTSWVRLEPTLFKDVVSVLRKKWAKLE